MDPFRDTAQESPTLTLDEVFEVLANERRRRILAHLVEQPDAQLGVDDIVELLAMEGRSEESIRLDLVHLHLPKLKDAGVIDYVEGSDAIEFQGDDLLERYLIRALDHDG